MEKIIHAFNKVEYEGKITVEEALRMRKSTRRFRRTNISFEDLGCLLWSTYGFRTFQVDGRTAPSAGACYPLIIYAIIGKDSISGVGEGIYLYSPREHSIIRHRPGDVRKELARAALNQDFIRVAPISIVISADFSKTTSRYGERGIRYVYIDLGHAGQNIYLQATSRGMGTVAVGAFTDDEVARVLSLPEDEKPLYIMPIGYIA